MIDDMEGYDRHSKFGVKDKLTEEEKDRLRESQERTFQDQKEFIEERKKKIEEEKKQTLLTKEVKEPFNSPELLDKRRKFLLWLVEENGFLSEVSGTEWIVDNHRGFFTVHDIDYPRVWKKKEDGVSWTIDSSGPIDESFFYNLSDVSGDKDEYRKKTIDLLRRLRNLDDWILEKENLDWLVEKEKHLGIIK